MKKTFFLLLLLCPVCVFAQSGNIEHTMPDSLLEKLKENRKADVARVEALDAVIMYFCDKQQITEAEPYINELYELSNELKDNFWKASSLYYESLCAMANYDYTEFSSLIGQALELAEALRDTRRTRMLLTRIYMAKSAYYFHINQFPECGEYIEKGLKLAEANGFESLKYNLENDYAALLMRMEDYEEAIVRFKTLSADSLQLQILLNIASAYVQLKQHDSALLYIDSVFSYAALSEGKDGAVTESLIKTCLIKSVCHMQQSQWDSAIHSLNRSSAMLKTYKEKQLTAINYLYLANANTGKGRYETALALVDSAIFMSREIEEAELEWFAVKLKSNVLDSLKDYGLEVEALHCLNILTDTLRQRENRDRVIEQKYRQEAVTKELEFKLNQMATRQKMLLSIALAALAVIVIILVSGFVLVKRKRKAEQLASELELRNREITAKTMGKMQNNETLTDIIEKLSDMEENPGKNLLPGAIRDLKALVDNDTKKDFDLHFVQMHPDFYQKLLADFPKLTQNELRLCAFIKSNLSIKEIAAINGISAESVKTARKRLRKSLNLTGEDTTLLEFLSKY